MLNPSFGEGGMEDGSSYHLVIRPEAAIAIIAIGYVLFKLKLYSLSQEHVILISTSYPHAMMQCDVISSLATPHFRPHILGHEGYGVSEDIFDMSASAAHM